MPEISMDMVMSAAVGSWITFLLMFCISRRQVRQQRRV